MVVVEEQDVEKTGHSEQREMTIAKEGGRAELGLTVPLLRSVTQPRASHFRQLMISRFDRLVPEFAIWREHCIDDPQS